MIKKDITVNYTVKELVQQIHEETQAQSLKLDSINTQVQLTNGRVTQLEKKSVGLWISNNIFKTIIFGGLLIALVISDFRQPIINAIISRFI